MDNEDWTDYVSTHPFVVNPIEAELILRLNRILAVLRQMDLSLNEYFDQKGYKW